ncbi:hypothetical protein [Bacillus sp. S10(2024)]|uniref:hypothetical protein n=1 Tax=Bacillus sp. S10(2024) TaxID=3162886 RepID=UPI003D24B9E3
MNRMIPYADILPCISEDLNNEVCEIQAILNATNIEGETYEAEYIVRIKAGIQREFLVLKTIDNFGLAGYGKEIRKFPVQFTVQVAEYLYTCLQKYIEMRKNHLKLVLSANLPIEEPQFSHNLPWEMR